jgi:NADPH-dependent glutamate synthase beta subunit-like oxidoreductase
MKILQDAIVREHCDVVVVGGGIGDLTAAALLARKGLQVLRVEQHYMPGGCCGAISVDHQTLRVENRNTVFAGGNIVRGAGTVIQAVADGRRAQAATHARLSRRRDPLP